MQKAIGIPSAQGPEGSKLDPLKTVHWGLQEVFKAGVEFTWHSWEKAVRKETMKVTLVSQEVFEPIKEKRGDTSQAGYLLSVAWPWNSQPISPTFNYQRFPSAFTPARKLLLQLRSFHGVSSSAFPTFVYNSIKGPNFCCLFITPTLSSIIITSCNC